MFITFDVANGVGDHTKHFKVRFVRDVNVRKVRIVSNEFGGRFTAQFFDSEFTKDRADDDVAIFGF